MNSMIKKEVEQIDAAVSDINEEIESACEENATPEQIEKAKGLTATIFLKYNGLLERLDSEDKKEVQRSIGLKVAKVEGMLSKLQEAPE